MQVTPGQPCFKPISDDGQCTHHRMPCHSTWLASQSGVRMAHRACTAHQQLHTVHLIHSASTQLLSTCSLVACLSWPIQQSLAAVIYAIYARLNLAWVAELRRHNDAGALVRSPARSSAQPHLSESKQEVHSLLLTGAVLLHALLRLLRNDPTCDKTCHEVQCPAMRRVPSPTGPPGTTLSRCPTTPRLIQQTGRSPRRPPCPAPSC